MFVYWGTYFVLLGLGVTIFLQIRWLNSGLQRFSALMIVPIFQSFWILVSVVAGTQIAALTLVMRHAGAGGEPQVRSEYMLG